ncbi:hypothetical protein APTSU1_000209300 [Apodemus speciosus]|uniref:Uncharacterized protein n=1 Tax=Apodemus speciosus TaxID=105296 RepID=A0ABQ0EIC3_APOSI
MGEAFTQWEKLKLPLGDAPKRHRNLALLGFQLPSPMRSLSWSIGKGERGMSRKQPVQR